MKFKVLPIPKKDLPHSCTLVHKVKKTSGWGETEEVTETELSSVRIYGPSKLVYSIQGNEATCSKSMLYDSVNSAPHGVQFQLDDEIHTEDEVFTIKVVYPVSTDDNNIAIHHVELGLC